MRAMDVRQVLAWSVMPGLVAGLVLLIVLRTEKDVTPDPRLTHVKDAGGRTFWSPVLALAILALLRAPETLLLLRLQHLGVPVSAIPLVWAGLHLVRTAVSYPGGWITDRIGSRGMVAAGGALFAAAAALLALPLSPVAAISVFLALGTVAGLTESSERTLVARLAPRRTGRGFGAYHAVTGVAALPAAIGFGWVYQHVDGGAAMGASAAGMLAATLGWLAVMPRRVDIR
jgi:MFS family permease